MPYVENAKEYRSKKALLSAQRLHRQGYAWQTLQLIPHAPVTFGKTSSGKNTAQENNIEEDNKREETNWRGRAKANCTKTSSELPGDAHQVKEWQVGGFGRHRPQLPIPKHETRRIGVSQNQIILQPTVHLPKSPTIAFNSQQKQSK